MGAKVVMEGMVEVCVCVCFFCCCCCFCETNILIFRWPTLSLSHRDSLTSPMLINAF